MGNYRSCERRSNLTSKVILLDGGLQEFTCTVYVSDLLQQNPNCFICSSDDMEFDEFVEEVGVDEVLRPGEIYFELPLRWRNHRLQAQEIAALAMKASLALSTSSTNGSDEHFICWCCCVSRRVKPMMLVFSEKEMLVRAADSSGGWEERGGVGCKGRKFVTKLSVIEE